MGSPVASLAAKEVAQFLNSKFQDWDDYVFEWCRDWWGGDFHEAGQTNPMGPEMGSIRERRGERERRRSERRRDLK
jgi:hypothetical protein